MAEDEWTKQNRLKAVENFKLFRLKLNQEEREERLSWTIDQRVAEVVRRMLTIPHLSCKPIGRSSKSSNTHDPHIDLTIGSMEPAEFQFHVRCLVSKDLIHEDDVIRQHAIELRQTAVEVLERLIDQHQGNLTVEANEGSDEKDRRILQDYIGFSPADIHKIDPSLGETKAIRLVRKANDCDPNTGALIEAK